MTEKLTGDLIVDIIEATVRVLIDTGLTREEALQVMLSQVATQVSPDVMKIASKLNAEYHHDFSRASWNVAKDDEDGYEVRSVDYALGHL